MLIGLDMTVVVEQIRKSLRYDQMIFCSVDDDSMTLSEKARQKQQFDQADQPWITVFGPGHIDSISSLHQTHKHSCNMGLYLLDYGAGNVRSLANSLTKLGHSFTWISDPSDFAKATVRTACPS